MELSQNDMLQLIEGLNLSEDRMAECRRLWMAGSYPELYGYLRSLRGDFLDDLHESQQRLDQLDYLIYGMKKKATGEYFPNCTYDKK